MSKRIVIFCAAMAICCGMSLAADSSFKGVVSDSMCGVKHGAAGAGSVKCVEGCVSRGAKYVLVSDGKVYQLDSQDKFKGMGGKEVTVNGTLSGDSIAVSSVSAGHTSQKTSAAKG